MLSIKRFLLLMILAVQTIILFVALYLGYLSSMDEANQLLDAELEALSGVLHQPQLNEAIDPLNQNTSPLLFQIYNKKTHQLISNNTSKSLIEMTENGFSFTNALGKRWRILKTETDQTIIVVGQSVKDRNQLTEQLFIAATTPLFLSTLVIGIGIYLVVRFGLSPLRQLNTQIKQKKANELEPILLNDTPLELTQVTEALNSLLGRLSVSLEQEKRFANDAAHELRNPIAALKAHLHNLQKSPQDATEIAHSLHKSISNLSNIVEQMLLLNRTSPEQFIARRQQISLVPLIQDVIAEHFQQIDDKKAEVSLVYEKPILLYSDTFALKTLITNLLNNALKYSNEQVQINIELQQLESHLTIAIEDSGSGIPEQERQRIFDRFYRAGADTHSSKTIGAGLGLAIVKHIVNLHEGDIQISDSRYETGTKIVITIPMTAIQA